MSIKLASTVIAVAIGIAAPAQSIAPVDEQPLTRITQQPGFTGILHTWGFIGDSLSSGEHESHNPDGSTGYHDLYQYSWGQCLCRATGTTGDNYSQGGETAAGWIEHFWDTNNNMNNHISAKDDPKQAYIIALGVNDRNLGYELGNPATDINLDDYTRNAPTFSGHYGGIIQRVRSISPDSKIFVVTMPRDGNDWLGFPDAIRQMADIFPNVYVIDLQKYAPEYDADFHRNFYMGGHLTAAGYQYTSWLMMNYIDWIIRHNMADFTQAAFIGTPHRY